jgi:hypothetical protein
MKKFMHEWSICTVPRTGSHYLREMLDQQTGWYIEKYHDVQKSNIITIVRDPFEIMVSDITMRAFYDSDIQINSLNYTTLANNYEKLSKELYYNADIFVNYNDLISRPYETTKKVAEKIGLDIVSDTYVSGLKDQPEYKHLVSSKTVSEYDIVAEQIKEFDLSGMYDIYNKLLSKCIEI